VIGHRKDIYK